MKRSAPTSTRAPSTVARTPMPVTESKSVIVGSAMPPSTADSTMARAIGCSERDSTAATFASTWLRSKPSAISRSVRTGRPSVSVPVLSTATTLASLSSCRASPLRNSTPISAPRPVPTMMEVGVAKPMAQGQAMISTATALTSAKDSAGDGPNTSQTRKVSTAASMTAGTNHSVTLSTTAWIGSLEPCACSTMRMICASMV